MCIMPDEPVYEVPLSIICAALLFKHRTLSWCTRGAELARMQLSIAIANSKFPPPPTF